MTQIRKAAEKRPLLLFFSSQRSGPARRMTSLIASVRVNEKRRLRVVEVDLDQGRNLASALDVAAAPALVLVHGSVVLDRLEGQATGPEIERFLRHHLER